MNDDSIDRYFARIGLDERPSPDLTGLEAVQRAHRLAIPFENLDIMLGRPIRIDSDSVFAQLVDARRGGYCFQNNRLFSDMLAALGFPNRSLLARVWLMLPEGVTPGRTHVLQLVDLDGKEWIADAGFGGSFTPPMPLHDGATRTSADGAGHRLRFLGGQGSLSGQWLLERAGPHDATDGRAAPHGDWQPQYTFDLDEVAPEDLEMGNHWTSTRSGTLFTAVHFVSIILPTGFASMTDRKLSVHQDGETDVTEISGPDEYRQKLSEMFGITLGHDEVSRLRLFAG